MKFGEFFKDAPQKTAQTEVTGVYCDSRKVTKDSIFVCIKGTAMDGHDYAADAVKAGAVAVVCERDLGLDNQILVNDTRMVYAQLCAKYFGNPASRLKLIGVTGTSGKTSVTYMLKSLLEQAGHKVGLIGTIQNIIGEQTLPAKNTTPDAYELHSLFALMEKAGCEYVVMEVSSHALDQKRVYGLSFLCGVFTNLTQDHLDYHQTMENYLQAKLQLFQMCQTAVINADDSYAKRVVESCNCKTLTVSAVSNDADFSAKEIKYKTGSVSYELVTTGAIGRVTIHTPGIFSVYNSMLAGVVGIAIGMDFHDVVRYLCNSSGVKGRVEVVPSDRDFTMIIDYAHTPDELENVLKMLNQIKKGRLVTLFGCGGDRDKGKRPIMGEIAARLSDVVIVTSDNPRSENPGKIIEDILQGMKDSETPYTVIENRADAIRYAIDNAQTDDVLLFAGKGHETYQILNSGTIHFDEREVIRDALKKD